ncbi:hypothetical protein Tsubulata_017072 [Turnera subulata]|uniref:Phosphoglycerate mutase-like protein 4 n=1 Tax=Turnera subulata TaxID=218843 RepID=A0A9Q0GDX6_9ROSI|nr:hypothetical protein Tsubulata_017072 [Turnera subulata]
MSALRTWHILGEPCLHCLPPSTVTSQSPLPRFKFYLTNNTTTILNLAHCSNLTDPPRTRSFKSPGSSPWSMADSDSSPVDAAYTEIIVVRHGETEWNADGRLQGHLDVELNEIGKQQAVSVADRLSKESNISVVYSSDLKRASDTAQTIAASCGGLEVIKDPGLRERNLGDLQGHVLRELDKVNSKAYQAITSHRTDVEIPGGGESLDQLYQRCTSSLQRIALKHRGERVVVVTHGGVIRALYKHACPKAKSAGKILNTSINIFHLFDQNDWKIKVWGDVSHLNPTRYLETGFGGDRTSG